MVRRLLSLLLAVIIIIAGISFSTFGVMAQAVEDVTQEHTIKDIELVKAPDKLSFEYGEVFDLRGAQFKVSYADGVVEDITIKDKEAILIGNHWQVYLEHIDSPVSVFCVYEDEVYKIRFSDYTFQTDITVSTDVLESITIENDGYDLLLINNYSSGRKTIQKALSITSGYGGGIPDYVMGGTLITDNGFYTAEICKNLNTNEFFIRLFVNGTKLTSNKLASCLWYDNPDNKGDVDGNGSIDVLDATHIQLHIAELKELSEEALVAADTDRDGEISITDATKIQLFLASMLPRL